MTQALSTSDPYARSWAERVFHATAFEVCAIGLSAPLAAWLTGKSLAAMGILTAVIAFMALVWNMIYNVGFDRLQKRYGFARTFWVRVAHAVGFEAGLILAAVPFVAWWLDVSLWHALVVDIGLVLFYLPYTFFYNLIYDAVRARIVARRVSRSNATPAVRASAASSGQADAPARRPV